MKIIITVNEWNKFKKTCVNAGINCSGRTVLEEFIKIEKKCLK